MRYFLRAGKMKLRLLDDTYRSLTTNIEEQCKKDSIIERESALVWVRLKELDAQEKSGSIILRRQVSAALK